jgi:hypothetical protein
MMRAADVMGWLYGLGWLGTFAFLTFFDGYNYTALNWIVALPANAFLAMIWPIYWGLLVWIM